MILTHYMYVDVYHRVYITITVGEDSLNIMINEKNVTYNNLIQHLYPDKLTNTFMSKHRANVKDIPLNRFFTHWILSVEEMTRVIPSIDFKDYNMFLPYEGNVKYTFEDIISNQYTALIIPNTPIYLCANADSILEIYTLQQSVATQNDDK